MLSRGVTHSRIGNAHWLRVPGGHGGLTNPRAGPWPGIRTSATIGDPRSLLTGARDRRIYTSFLTLVLSWNSSEQSLEYEPWQLSRQLTVARRKKKNVPEQAAPPILSQLTPRGGLCPWPVCFNACFDLSLAEGREIDSGASTYSRVYTVVVHKENLQSTTDKPKLIELIDGSG